MPVFFLSDSLYLDPNHEALTLYNQAFKYGDGIFETIRVFRGKPMFMEAHFARMFTGMYFLKYNFQEEKFQERITEGVYRTIVAGNFNHARLRVQVFRYHPLLPPDFLIEANPIEDFYSSISTHSITDFKLLPLFATPLSAFKHNNRLVYQMANIHASESGYDEAILYYNQHVAETSNMNIFMVKDKKVFTPPLACGCLNGIMRLKVIQLCQSLKIPVKDMTFTSKALAKADEIFLTNVIRGIAPVWRYNDDTWDTQTLPITTYLRNNLFQTILENK